MRFLHTLICLALIVTCSLDAQVAIGNKIPALGTILHVDDGSGTTGVKLPNADIADLNTEEPLPAGIEVGTMVYNTNAFTGKGHFYWNGFVWAPIQLFAKSSSRFKHGKPTESNNAVNLNKQESTGGVDAELLDAIDFNENTSLFVPVNDAAGRTTSLRVREDGRYRITVFIGLEQDDSAASTGSTSIQGRLKITNSSNVVRYDGTPHRSTEMDRNGTGDDDGTLYFTEVININADERIAINCTSLEGLAAVYQRDPNLSAFIIEKLR
jgi:hypothetical protein